ncbi:MAG: class II aldolase/adducin family protein [bacterium]|nr:class II aldolase/adducin family protein [bacterium]
MSAPSSADLAQATAEGLSIHVADIVRYEGVFLNHTVPPLGEKGIGIEQQHQMAAYASGPVQAAQSGRSLGSGGSSALGKPIPRWPSMRATLTCNVVMTPHAYPYEDMTPDDLAVLAPDGTQIDGRLDPSYDSLLHMGVYSARPEVFSVLHTEPPYVNAFGALGRDIPPVTTTGLKSANGSIPIMPFRLARGTDWRSCYLRYRGATSPCSEDSRP